MRTETEKARADQVTDSNQHSTPKVGTDEYIVWFWLQRLKHLRSYTEHRGVVTDPDLHEDLREIGYEDAMAAFDRLVEQFEVLKQAAQEVETLTFRQYVDWMHFHELAMARPFEAESEAQNFARRVSSLLTIALGADTTIEVIGGSNQHSERLDVWAHPLTDNERAIIASIIDGADESDLVKKWLRHVIKCYDGLFEQYENAEAQLRDIRRQMEELRDKGHWPVSRLLGQLESSRKTEAESWLRALKAEEQLESLQEKPDQPLLNAARRLVKATDNAERNYALADLVVALERDSNPATKFHAYCKDGSLQPCEDCVGSCGIEEAEEAAQSPAKRPS